MKKEVFVIVGLIFLISAGAFAQSIADTSVSKEVSDYVTSFIEKDAINNSQITDITKIDQSSLPEDIEIKDINENNVGIYQVNFTKENKQDKIYVITYSSKELKKKQENVLKNIQSLNFGYIGESSSSDYLYSATGVKSGVDNGYVMMKSGSITGISTSLNLNGEGILYVKVYKNGKDTGFSNMINSEDKNKRDYDLQSENIVTYEAGDVISVYLESTENLKWSNVITLVEITS